MATVLLDTMVAAGVLSLNDKNGKKKAWQECVLSLLGTVPTFSVVLPTSVFYELAARDKGWLQFCFNRVKSQSEKGFFKYINHSITSDILRIASGYRLLCDFKDNSNDENDRKQKISFGDAILAGYCLNFGYHLITLNQKDFNPNYFEVISMYLAPMPNKRSERKVVYLLKPKLNNWDEEFSSIQVHEG